MAARTRTLAQLRADVRREADVEGAEDRHPNAEIDRLINQGATELRDLLIKARGRSFFRAGTPHTITTVQGTTRYALPAKFLRLLSLRVAGESGYMLAPFTDQDEPDLRASTAATDPTHYELQAGYVEVLPSPRAGVEIVLDYIEAHTDLVADGDTLEGYDGWEDYPVFFAARRIARKDGETALVNDLLGEMNRIAGRIQSAAAHRDAFRAERVKDTRRTRLLVGRR